MSPRLLPVLVVVASLVAASGAGAAADPVSWREAERLVVRHAGSFTKTMTAEVGGNRRTLTREWIEYDLPRKLIDRRIGLGDRPDTARVEVPKGRERADLRFVYRADGALMWNPGVRKWCGTPWVEMGPLLLKQFGIKPGELFVNEPAEILATRRGKPRLVASDRTATVYEVGVVATAGVPFSSGVASNPAALRKLSRETAVARVRVIRDGDLELSIDLTHAVEVVTGAPAGGPVEVTWRIARTPIGVAAVEPAKVAPGSCLS